MTQVPTVEPETTPKFQPPYNTQFSVFVDNKVGKLYDVLELFHGHALTVAGFSVIDSTDHAVVRIITSNSDLARRLLERNELPSSEASVLVVEVSPEKPLTEVCRVLTTAEINIHFVYPLMVRPRGLPAVVLHTDDAVLSAQILRRKLFTLFGENDLGGNASRGRPGSPTDPSEN